MYVTWVGDSPHHSVLVLDDENVSYKRIIVLATASDFKVLKICGRRW